MGWTPGGTLVIHLEFHKTILNYNNWTNSWKERIYWSSAKLQTMTVTFPGDCTIYTADEYKQNYMLCAGTGKLLSYLFACSAFFFKLTAFSFSLLTLSRWHCLSVPFRRGITIGSNNRWCRLCSWYHVKESRLRSCSRTINDLHPPFRLLRLVQHDRWTPTPTVNKKQIFN